MEDMRLFSQEGDISQLTSCYDIETNQDELHNETMAERFRYNGQDEDSQNPSETQFSSRAEAICEENRQIDHILESQLLGLEKKRMLLASKLIEAKKDFNKYKDIHECQSQKILKLQMNLEEYTEKYQIEFSGRLKLKEKAIQLETMMTYLENHFLNGKSVGNETEEFKHHMFKKVEESLKKDISAQKTKIIHDNKQKIEHEIDQCKEAREAMLKQREENLEMIQNLARQHFDKASTVNSLQEESIIERNDLDLKTSELNEIINNKKRMTEELHSLNEQHDEYRKESTELIHNLKLQHNIETNHVFNLEEKFKEKECTVNKLTFNLNEGVNLSNQMKISIDEIILRSQAIIQGIEEIKNKNNALKVETGSLDAGIKQYENVETENKLLKDKIGILNQYINDKNEMFLENEECVQKLVEQEVKASAILDRMQEHINSLQLEVINTEENYDNLVLRFGEDNKVQQLERESKMLRNEKLATEKLNKKSLLTKLTFDLKEIENVNMTLKTQIEEMEQTIEICNKNIAKNAHALKEKTEEWENTFLGCNESLKLKNDKLESYKILLSEAKPIQEQTPVLLEKKLLLEQELKVQIEVHQKDIENHEKRLLFEMLEMDKEMENHKLIMKKWLSKEDEATDKYTEDFMKIEKTKVMQEKELKALNDLYDRLKKTESMKRVSIAKMGRSLKTFNKEVREDMSNAISSKVSQVPCRSSYLKPMKHKLMTPLHSSCDEPMQKKQHSKCGLSQVPATSVKDKMEVNTVDDEYEFSEI